MIILGCHTIQNPHILPFLILYRSRGNYKWVLILACMCARTCFSCVQLFAVSWIVAPLFVEFSRQEYWNGLLFSSLGYLPTQGLNLGLLYCRQILYHLSHQVLKIKLSFFTKFQSNNKLSYKHRQKMARWTASRKKCL